MRNGYTYKLENIVTGWAYYGSTDDVNSREGDHYRDAFVKRMNRYSKMFYDMDMYGWESFNMVVIKEWSDWESQETRNDMSEFERQLIEENWEKCYNKTRNTSGIKQIRIGERNPNCKTSIQVVELIKDMLEEGLSPKEIVEELGVTISIVDNIKYKRAWNN